LNSAKSKVEEGRKKSEKVGEVGKSSRNIERNEIEEIARIRRSKKVENGREKSEELGHEKDRKEDAGPWCVGERGK
jgi:hypothetical protein